MEKVSLANELESWLAKNPKIKATQGKKFRTDKRNIETDIILEVEGIREPILVERKSYQFHPIGRIPIEDTAAVPLPHKIILTTANAEFSESAKKLLKDAEIVVIRDLKDLERYVAQLQSKVRKSKTSEKD